jgi:hypothetical protein
LNQAECTKIILNAYDLGLADQDITDYLSLDMEGRRARRRHWGIDNDSDFAERWNSPEIIDKKLLHAFCYADVVVLTSLKEMGLKLSLVSSSPPPLARGEMALLKSCLPSWPFDWYVDVSRGSGRPMKPAPEVAFQMYGEVRCAPGEDLCRRQRR